MQIINKKLLEELLIGTIELFDSRSDYEKQEEKKLIEAIRNAPKSLRVVGRGTIVVDPAEIANSPGFKRDLQRAKELVEYQNRKRAKCQNNNTI